jgi:hypothetical protein
MACDIGNLPWAAIIKTLRDHRAYGPELRIEGVPAINGTQ